MHGQVATSIQAQMGYLHLPLARDGQGLAKALTMNPKTPNPHMAVVG